MSRSRDSDEKPLADVEIGAVARAERLRFKRKPRTAVSFETAPDGESDSQTERENLPEEVEPGEIYRDLRIAWRGGARIVLDEDALEEGENPEER